MSVAKRQGSRYSANMVRKRIFDPRLKIKKTEKEKGKTIFEPEPGVTFIIDSILDQTDMNILIALETIKRKKIKKDGAVFYAFSLRELQKVLNINSKSNHKWIKEKLAYLKTVAVTVKIKEDDKTTTINTGLIRKWGYIDILKNLQDGRGKTVFGDNSLFYITIESEFASVIERDLHIYISDDKYKDLLSIEDGYTQMIIKFLLTQKAKPEKYRINIEKALEKIGVDKKTLKQETYKKIRSRVKKNLKKYGEKFNITLENDIIIYSQIDSVYHDTTPIKELPEIKSLLAIGKENTNNASTNNN